MMARVGQAKPETVDRLRQYKYTAERLIRDRLAATAPPAPTTPGGPADMGAAMMPPGGPEGALPPM